MKPVLRWSCLLLLSCLAPGVLAACPPQGWSREALEALKVEAFALEDSTRRQALALGLIDCLADPDPRLRDGIAYEAHATWLRGDALTPETRRALMSQLLARLTPDDEGFGAPFAALVLSEVARTDRILAWMTPVQREDLVQIGSVYLASVRDYRGFDTAQGWRHGVAHGADLLMQLALNPALDRAQLDRILAAVATQVAPAGGHFYTYGEPERLARPVLFALKRGLHDDAAWSAWLQGVAAPAPLPDWSAAFSSQAGLAKRHNTRAFLLALYVGLAESGDDTMKARLPAVVAALRGVP
jgi:hypothetical protein